MNNILSEKIAQLSLNDFVKEVTMGKISSELMEISKKISCNKTCWHKKNQTYFFPISERHDMSSLNTENQSLVEEEIY